MKQNLIRLKKSRNLAKWDIELGEHDIDYWPRSGIKAQALADFLVEILDMIDGVLMSASIDPSDPEARKQVWELHTDCAASKKDLARVWSSKTLVVTISHML